MEGWIKIHRKLLKKGYYKDSHYVHLWVHLLMKSNHESNEFLFNGKMITIQRGQLLTGRNTLSEETGIESSKVERIIKVLKSEQQIEQQTFNKFRIITICNYEDYQEVNKKVNNKRTTSEQQMNTNKNDKNDKKEIHTSKNSVTPCTEQELQDIATKLQVSLVTVRNKHSVILNKIEAKEFKNKTVYLTLENWIIGDIDKGFIKKVTSLSIADKFPLYQPKAI